MSRACLWGLLLLAMLPVLAQDAPVNPATVPTPRTEPRWVARHEALVKQAKAGGIDVLLLGDSITEQWTSIGKEAWKAQLAPLKAANFGISADRTEHLLWRIQQGELDGIAPKVVVVMIGTNNVKGGGAQQAPAEVAAGVAAVLAEVRARLPESKVLLVGLLPRQTTKYDWIQAAIAETNVRLNDVATEHESGWLDIGGRFSADDKVDPTYYQPDELHLNAAGYAAWAEAMVPVLRVMMMAR